jgi:predicted kinase
MYSTEMTQQTYRKLLEDGFAALDSCSRPRPDATRAGVILDATFSTRALRKFLRDGCNKANMPFQLVELDVDAREIKKRLRSRDEKTAETSDARLADFEKLNAAYEPPTELVPDLIKISADGAVTDTVRLVLCQLAEKQAALGGIS